MPPKGKGTRAPKWSEAHRAQFRQLIKNKKINPQNSTPAYVDKIRERYFPDRPVPTFRNNYKSSVSEWRVGQAIAEANEARAAKGETF